MRVNRLATIVAGIACLASNGAGQRRMGCDLGRIAACAGGH